MLKTSFPMWSRRRNAVCEWSRDPCHDRTETIVNLPVKRDEAKAAAKCKTPRAARPRSP